MEANNNAVDTFESIKYLAERCPVLGILMLYCNPLSRYPRYRGKIIQSMPNLKMLDATEVTVAEVESYGETTAITITKELIQENSSGSTKTSRGRLLSTDRYTEPTGNSFDFQGDDWE